MPDAAPMSDGAEGPGSGITPVTKYSPDPEIGAPSPQEQRHSPIASHEASDVEVPRTATAGPVVSFEEPEEEGDHLLRKMFDSYATNGMVLVEQLPMIIRDMQINAVESVVKCAIAEVLPDAPATLLVNFGQLEEVWDVVVEEMAHEGSEAGLPDAPKKSKNVFDKVMSGIKMRRCLGQSDPAEPVGQGHEETKSKPTTRLLLVTTSVTSVIALAVAAFAVVFLFADTLYMYERSLLHTTRLTKDALVLFAERGFHETQRRNMHFTTSLIGDVVEATGYNSSVRIYQGMFLSMKQLLASATESGFAVGALGDVLDRATAAAGWLEAMWDLLGEAAVVRVVNSLNQRKMRPWHEIVLGRWNATRAKIQFLTNFRFGHLCLGGRCGSDPTAAAPMLAALSGATGSLLGNDYRPHPVYAGYSFLEGPRVGVVFKIDVEAAQDLYIELASQVVNEMNLNRKNTLEIVLGRLTPHGSLQWLSDLVFCNGCNVSAWEAPDIRRALAGESGSMVTDDYRPAKVVSGYGPLSSLNLAVAIQIDLGEIQDSIGVSLARSLDGVNQKINTTEEMMFVWQREGQTTVVTDMKFRDQCSNATCEHDVSSGSFIRNAVELCRDDIQIEQVDYRGAAVDVGQRCLPFLDGALLMKVDLAQIDARGTQISVNYVNSQNAMTADTTQEIMLAERRAGVAAANVTGRADFRFLTEFKLRDRCPGARCPDGNESAVWMSQALRQQRGTEWGVDYRGEAEVLAAYDFMDEKSLGLVVKVDMEEVQAPAWSAAVKLFLICLGAIVASIFVLGYIAKRMLDQIERAWEDGKADIEHERQQFRALVHCMYPPVVSELLMQGETQIVLSVPHAAVFFSDIYDWTARSNGISSAELVSYLGYTYRVMDGVGDYLGVYKVKTIGDAYLAIAGLPGPPAPAQSQSPCLDMLRFASYCAQIFSQRFSHGEQGSILASVDRKKTVRTKAVKMAPQLQTTRVVPAAAPLGPPATDRRATMISDTSRGAASAAPSSLTIGTSKSSGTRSSRSTRSSGVEVAGALGLRNGPVGCVMLYGIASGPVNAGVLQGKTPAFDIWGKTVNLASRMQTTGQPGRIQISDAMYEAVTADPASPFTFEGGHTVFAKGFGNITAYFVRGSLEAPPKLLLQALQLDTFYGPFFHDSPFQSAEARRASEASSHSHDSRASRTPTQSPVQVKKGWSWKRGAQQL